MKKRLLSALLGLAMVATIMPMTVLAAETVLDAQTHHDPFTKSTAFECYSYNSLTKNDTKGHFGGGSGGSYVMYNDMDFGTQKGGKVTVYYGLGGNYNGSFDVRIGSASGEIIANVPTSTTQGGWDSEGSKTVEITTPVTGDDVDIYVTWNGTAGNFFGIQFDSKYTSYTGPEVKWKNASGAEIGLWPLTQKLSAVATIDRNQTEAEERKANVLVAQYKRDSMDPLRVEMLGVTAGTEKAIANGITDFSTADAAKITGTSFTAAYWWFDDNTIVKPSTIRGTVSAQSGTAASTKIDVNVSGEKVEVSGTGIEDDRVIILIVPGKYNDGDVFYNLNPVHIWETGVTGSAYYNSCVLPNAASGEYTAVVMGESLVAPLTKEFTYTNPSEIYTVLQALDASSDESDTISILQNNASLFGTESGLYPNMLAFDKQIIHNEIKAEFVANPLTSAVYADYTPWVERIKASIVPDVIMGAIKGSKNAAVIADNMLKYQAELGFSSNSKFNTYFKTPASASEDIAGVYANNRKEIVNIMSKDATGSMVATDIVTLFDNSVAVGMFNAAKSWGYADAAINAFESEFSSDMQADIAIYNKLANEYKMEVMNKFLNKNFADLAAIEALMAGIIDEYNNPEYFATSKYELEQPYVGNIDLVIDMLHSTLPDENEESTTKSFTDIDSVSWARSSITYMASMGYVNGKSDTTFAPNDNITREEFAAILVRTFGLDTTNVAPSTFADVDNNAWYAQYVATAAHYGIVNGLENNNFGVGQQITREQIATMLKRTVDIIPQKLLPFKGTIAFADFAYISDWAYSSVMYLARAQIINGTGNDQFSPKKNATRAEAVVMIHRLLQNLI